MTMTEQSTARATAQTAKEGGKQVASDAAQQAGALARDAWSEARGVIDSARGEVRTQAQSQAQRAASGMRTLSDQIRALADGRPEEAGRAGELARTAGDRLSTWATRLDTGGIDGMLDDVGRFARRKPGTFLLACAGLGFVAGRVLKAARASSEEQSMSGTYGTTPSMGLPYRGSGDPYATPGALTTPGLATMEPVPVTGGAGTPIIDPEGGIV